MQHLQLGPISHSLSLQFADTIAALSPAISLPPKASSSISHPQPTFDCTLAAAAARTAMIHTLPTQPPNGPMIVPTANLNEVIYSFSATEMSHCSRES